MSRGTAHLWDKILRVTLKALGVRVTLKCGTREKGVQTVDVILLSLPRETVVMVLKILEVSWKRQNRETWAGAKDLAPWAIETPDVKAAVDKEWKEVTKVGTKTKDKESPLCHIDGHPPHPKVRVHPGECSQEQSLVWTQHEIFS